MARRPVNKTDSIASPGLPNTSLNKAAILPVGANKKVDLSKQALGSFLVNPASWEMQKDVNWISKNVPGQSDPILQYVSGGPRTVSFQALVTKETSHLLNPPETDIVGEVLGAVTNAVSSIASSFANVPVPPIGDLFGGPSEGLGDELSISGKLRYYESLLYPKYEEGVLKESPPLVYLYVGSTLNDSNQHVELLGTVTPKTSLWVITGLSINVTKQLQNLSPLEALVDFKLMQYIITPKSSTDFVLSEPPSNDELSIGNIIPGVDSFPDTSGFV